MDGRCWAWDEESPQALRDPDGEYFDIDAEGFKEYVVECLNALEQRVADAERERDFLFKQAQELITERNAERAEAQRYREALEAITANELLPNEHMICYSGWGRQAIARAALADAAKTELDPAPRYDAVYEEGMKLIDATETGA